jgi:hypothetical protein
MDVRTFPLVNGQELVVDLVSIDDDLIYVKTPMVFQTIVHPETGRPVHGFGEWPALAEASQVIRIPLTSVLAMPAKVHEEVERNYTANVTGLALPPATPKILLS